MKVCKAFGNLTHPQENIIKKDRLGIVRISKSLKQGLPWNVIHPHHHQAVKTFGGVSSIDGLDAKNLIQAANQAMAVLAGIQPQDEIEAMLAVQMIGVHNMAMETIGRAMLGGQTFEGRKCNVDYTTKMLRTFIAQVEALKRYRNGGPQNVKVGEVNVNEGGQAIVGTVNQRVSRDLQNP